MDITSITTELKTADRFVFDNRIILFSKITSYDDGVRMNIHSKCFSGESWPSAFEVKYYFNVYCGGDQIEVGVMRTIFPKQYKIWKTKKIFGFLPIKYKGYKSDFWEQCSLNPLCTELSYLKSGDYNKISWPVWFGQQAEIEHYYNFINKIYQDFISKFNEYKKYNS
jgi:hypothetical protein